MTRFLSGCFWFGVLGSSVMWAGPARMLEGQNAALEARMAALAGLLPEGDQAGAMVGLVRGSNELVGAVGNPAFTADTLFEFGSITKVFTAILLAQLIEEDLLKPGDPVNAHLPDSMQDPKWEAVTLEQLATHTAGIPRLPPNLKPTLLALTGKGNDPYAGFDERKLEAGMRKTAITAPGTRWDYSNFGFAILGAILQERTGTPYADLAKHQLFEPFGMKTATVEGWSSDQIAPPLNAKGKPGTHWNLNAFSSAGAAKGSIRDGLAFVRASMEACAGDTLEARANCLAQQPTSAKTQAGDVMGLAWIRADRGGKTILWHNGGTGGYHSFLGFDPRRKTGIVVLGNVADLEGIDGWAMETLLALEPAGS